MLVRISTMLLVRNPFPSQPMTFVQTPSRSNSLADEEIISPNVTARSANISVHSSEYGIVTDITSTTIDVTSSLLLQSSSKDTSLLDSAIDRSSAELDINMPQKSVRECTNLKSGDTLVYTSQTPIPEIQDVETPKFLEVIEVQSQKQVLEQVLEPVQEPVHEEVKKPVKEVLDQVLDQVSDQVKDQVNETMQEQVQEKVKEQVEVQEQAEVQEQQVEVQAEVQEEQKEEQVKKEIQEQETILLDIPQRRMSYAPEISLVNIMENEEISNEPEIFESIFEKKVKDKMVKRDSIKEPIKSILLEKSISSVYPRTSLLDKPIPTYINKNETVDDDNVVYYKRREDYHSKPVPRIETMTPSASTTSQRKRYSLYAALGTRIHPRSSLDDSKGMPVFQAPAATVTDKLKPKTVLKRIKTIVKNKKKSTTS